MPTWMQPEDEDEQLYAALGVEPLPSVEPPPPNYQPQPLEEVQDPGAKAAFDAAVERFKADGQEPAEPYFTGSIDELVPPEDVGGVYNPAQRQKEANRYADFEAAGALPGPRFAADPSLDAQPAAELPPDPRELDDPTRDPEFIAQARSDSPDTQPEADKPSPFTTDYNSYASEYGKPDANVLRLAGSVPEPPKAPERNDGMLIAAGVLDLLLNKGRNAGNILGTLATPDDTAYENYDRQMKHAKSMADVYSLGRRGTGYARPVDPQMMELRRLQYEARLDDIEIKKQEAARKAKQWNAVNKPHTPEAEALVEYGVANGMDREKIKDLPVTTLLRVGGAPMAEYAKKTGIIGDAGIEYAGQVSREQAEQTMQPKIETARGISDATQQNKLDLAAAQAGLRKEGEEREYLRDLGKESRAFAERYETKNRLEMDVTTLMDRVKSAPGGVEPGLFERFQSSITAHAIGKDRIVPWQAKHMILELWSRSQSGAAISDGEQGKFVIQVGMDPKASEEQIEAAFDVLGQVIDRRLRGSAAANPGAAGAVLKASGISGDRLKGLEGVPVPTAVPGAAPAPQAAPAQPSAAPSAAPRAPEAAPAGAAPAGAAPAASPASGKTMRRGKVVANVRKTPTAGGGLRVEIFYEDGSKEVVERE